MAKTTEMMKEAWWEAVERIRREHNGVFRVDLYFGHDGDNLCEFSNYTQMVAHGQSGRSMQQAVERCLADWASRKLKPLGLKPSQAQETGVPARG